MNKKSTAGHSQDRSKIAGGQNYEVNYEKEKLSAPGKQIQDAVKSENSSRRKIEQKIRRSLL